MTKCDHDDSSKLVWNWVSSKRTLEKVHVFIWAMKDFLWLRACPSHIIVVLGVVALFLSMIQLTIDANELAWASMNGKSIQDAWEEMFLTIAVTFWLVSNTWWAYGECRSLRQTATFDELYDRCTEQSVIIIWFAIACTVIFFILNLSPGKKKEAQVDTRQSCQSSLDHSSRTLSLTSNRWNSPRTDLLDPLVIPPEIANTTRSCDYSRVEELSTALFSALDSASLLVHVPEMGLGDDSPTGSYCASLDELADCNPPIHCVTEEEISRQIECQNVQAGHSRTLEEIFIFLWILKDLFWMLEWKWEWTFVATVIVCIIGYSVVTYLRSPRPYSNEGDAIFMSLLMLWVTSNIVWAGGEIFFTDDVEGIPSGNPKRDLEQLIPAMYSPRAIGLSPCWEARWIASWILFVALGIITTDVVRHIYSGSEDRYVKSPTMMST